MVSGCAIGSMAVEMSTVRIFDGEKGCCGLPVWFLVGGRLHSVRSFRISFSLRRCILLSISRVEDMSHLIRKKQMCQLKKVVECP
jgi:hypothetical protein